ncbi:hypothetical protein KHQ89_07990 [Mycoplasmatota bacterium]|nr:hypothetical protein KHQ89_07990 [Mycoplasmatota bacterium]
MKNIYRKMIIFSLSIFFIVVFFTPQTLAYWIDANGVSGANDNADGMVAIGQWSSANNVPDGITLWDETENYSLDDLVWYEGDIYMYRHYNSTAGEEPSNANNWRYLRDLDWHATVTYFDGEIVYHNGVIYEAQHEGSGDEPGTAANNQWDSLIEDSISWTTGQATTLDEIVYYNGQLWQYHDYYTTSVPGSEVEWGIVGDLTYNSNYVYSDNSLVLYNGNYYYTTNGGWASSSTPGTNGAWIQVTISTWTSTSVTKDTKYVLYNGLIYEALVAQKNRLKNEPGTAASYGYWQAINTDQWQQYNTYVTDDLVMWDSEVWILANASNSSVEPGTAANSWNDSGSLDYEVTSTYANGDYAIYNDLVYVVVNATNANQYAPGVIANSWNLLSGYEWYDTNVYYNGETVYHSGAVYTANVASTTAEPGVSSDWIIVGQ